MKAKTVIAVASAGVGGVLVLLVAELARIAREDDVILVEGEDIFFMNPDTRPQGAMLREQAS